MRAMGRKGMRVPGPAGDLVAAEQLALAYHLPLWGCALVTQVTMQYEAFLKEAAEPRWLSQESLEHTFAAKVPAPKRENHQTVYAALQPPLRILPYNVSRRRCRGLLRQKCRTSTPVLPSRRARSGGRKRPSEYLKPRSAAAHLSPSQTDIKLS